MDIKLVPLEIPEGGNVILGQSHFIKTVEDIYEAIVNTVPQMKFGVAFNPLHNLTTNSSKIIINGLGLNLNPSPTCFSHNSVLFIPLTFSI